MTWNPEARDPENSAIIIKGKPVDIQNEDRFASVGGFAFNPLAQELFALDNFVLLFLLSKVPKGQLVGLMKDYMKGVTKILCAVAESGKAHPLTALNASTQFASVAHRFGIISDQHYLKMADQTRSIIDKLIQLDFAGMAMDGLTTLVEKTVSGVAGTTLLPKQSITEAVKGTPKIYSVNP